MANKKTSREELSPNSIFKDRRKKQVSNYNGQAIQQNERRKTKFDDTENWYLRASTTKEKIDYGDAEEHEDGGSDEDLNEPNRGATDP